MIEILCIKRLSLCASRNKRDNKRPIFESRRQSGLATQHRILRAHLMKSEPRPTVQRQIIGLVALAREAVWLRNLDRLGAHRHWGHSKERYFRRRLPLLPIWPGGRALIVRQWRSGGAGGQIWQACLAYALDNSFSIRGILEWQSKRLSNSGRSQEIKNVYAADGCRNLLRRTRFHLGCLRGPLVQR